MKCAVSRRLCHLALRALPRSFRRHYRLILCAVAAAAGLGWLTGLTHLMSALLYGVSPVDPLTQTLAPAGLLAVALVAGYVPASRAARVDPTQALRVEQPSSTRYTPTPTIRMLKCYVELRAPPWRD